MKRTAKVFFNIACIIGVVVAVWHFQYRIPQNGFRIYRTLRWKLYNQ